MYRAEKRERFLLGVAAGAVLAAILVIPLAIALNNRLGSEVSADTQPPDQVQASPTFDPAAAAEGETLFASCVACHGPDAKGIAGLGKTLIESDFVNGSDDAELVAFLKVGRSTSDPANTTGVDMPPKGGNPALSDEDLGFIVAYIRSLS